MYIEYSWELALHLGCYNQVQNLVVHMYLLHFKPTHCMSILGYNLVLWQVAKDKDNKAH